MSETHFYDLLRSQIRNEFTASQQYVAVAVWFDAQDLPQLARHFYQQSLEERNHAMMIIRYLLDKDLDVKIPDVGSVRNEFSDVMDPLNLALAQERDVTIQIETLARAARAAGDYLGEQFMHWFLKEQVEEVSSMNTLVTVATRAGGNLFHLEDYMAREFGPRGSTDPTAPTAAGGAI
jgi:ferritin